MNLGQKYPFSINTFLQQSRTFLLFDFKSKYIALMMLALFRK